MVEDLEDVEMPNGVKIERFMRTKLNLVFVGGQSKTVEYDLTATSDGVKKYKKFVDYEGTEVPEGARDGNFSLEDNNVTPRKTVSRLYDEETALLYDEIVESEKLYLVTWDYGRSIYVMDEQEAERIARAILTQEDHLSVDDLILDDEVFSDSPDYAEAPVDPETETSQSKQAPPPISEEGQTESPPTQ